MNKLRIVTGSLTEELIEQFKACKSYPQWEMQLALRGVDFQDVETRDICRRKMIKYSFALIRSCIEIDEFDVEKVSFLKEFWKNPRGLFNGDVFAADKFLLDASEYMLVYVKHDEKNMMIWKDLMKFLVEISRN